MLLYGTAIAANLVVDSNKVMVYNLTSMSEAYSRSNLNIIPPNNLGSQSEYEFDVKYMNWIFQNDSIFVEFMKIIDNLYKGVDVFLVMSDNDWSETLVESLLKLIQQRYGVNATHIETMEDLFYAEESNFAEGYGIANLDMDMDRYTYLTNQDIASKDINSGVVS